MSAERQTKGRVKDSRIHNPVIIPVHLSRIWNTFWILNRSRQGTGYGPAPLQYSELLAYCQLVNEKLDGWEVRVFRNLDYAYLDEVAIKQSEDK
jgi:hypothetical protein